MLAASEIAQKVSFLLDVLLTPLWAWRRPFRRRPRHSAHTSSRCPLERACSSCTSRIDSSHSDPRSSNSGLARVLLSVGLDGGFTAWEKLANRLARITGSQFLLINLAQRSLAARFLILHFRRNRTGCRPAGKYELDSGWPGDRCHRVLYITPRTRPHDHDSDTEYSRYV